MSPVTFPSRSTLPRFQVFDNPETYVPSSSMPAAPAYDPATMGIGRALGMSPALAAFGRSPDGIGAFNTPAGPVGVGVGLLLLAGVGALSYQVGKAMAPRGSKASTWGWIAAPVGLFTGPIGLGVMAIISNGKD